MVFQRFPEDTRKRLRDHEDNTEAKRIMKTRFECNLDMTTGVL